MKHFYILIFWISILITIRTNSQVFDDDFEPAKQVVASDSIPTDFPTITVDVTNNPAPGYFFLGNNMGKSGTSTIGNYIMILDTAGKVMAYKKIGSGSTKLPRSFQQVANGLITYTEETAAGQLGFILDESLNKLDSIPGYNAGFLDILPNGNYVICESENIPSDLSNVFQGGEPNATLVGSRVYEFDRNKNIVFLWRTVDYLPLSDTYADTLVTKVDFTHTNMGYPDYDGNYLVSNRNLSTITKVNKRTGDIVWKLGGRQSDFTFINENEQNAPNYFSYEHHVRRTANGNITMFDNGVQHNPQYSRGVEYKLDETNKTATMIWEYRQTPDVFAKAEGSMQTLPNGNKVIGWGEASLKSGPVLTELKPDNTIAFQISFPANYKSMMASKFSWKSNIAEASVYNEVAEGNTYNFSKKDKNTCVKMLINQLTGLTYATVYVDKFNFAPKNPEFAENPLPMVKDKRILIRTNQIDSFYVEIRFNASCLELTYKPEEYKVYQRDTIGKGVFRQIPTVYDADKGDLVISTSKIGEFIFGIPEPETKPGIPVLISPNNMERINRTKPVQISWSPHGYFSDSHLMIATDTNFVDVVVDSVLKGIKYNFSTYNVDKKYFWKVQTINVNTKGDWSETRSFSPSEPFISMVYPNGGEVLEKDSLRKIIRWNKNITDQVRIELYKNSTFVSIIKDSLTCPTGAFGWIIPKATTPDSIYKIKISSIKDSTLYSFSENTFTVKDAETSVNDDNINNINFNITPNPASDNVSISFSNFGISLNSISIFNCVGNEIKRYNENEILGIDSICLSTGNLPSGLYYCTLNAGNKKITKSFVIIR